MVSVVSKNMSINMYLLWMNLWYIFIKNDDFAYEDIYKVTQEHVYNFSLIYLVILSLTPKLTIIPREYNNNFIIMRSKYNI